MQFQNQAAINNNIKTIKATFSRWNNWLENHDQVARREQELKDLGDAASKDEVNENIRAIGAHWERPRPAHPRQATGEAYYRALYCIAQALKDEHGIVVVNTPSAGGNVATAREIFNILGEGELALYEPTFVSTLWA